MKGACSVDSEPGARFPLRLTAPVIRPVPASDALAAMLTGPEPVPEPVELMTPSVPALTVVPPENVLAPLRSSSPVSVLIKLPAWVGMSAIMPP